MVSESNQQADCTVDADARRQSLSAKPGDSLFLYSYVFLAVLLPDLAAVFGYSAVLLGPDVYGQVANKNANMMGNGIGMISFLWLCTLFVFDVFDGTVRSLLVQVVGLLTLVALVFVGFTLKAVSYPWVPMVLCLCLTVFALAFKRERLKEDSVSLKQFYRTSCLSYSICALVVGAIWAYWILNGNSPQVMWLPNSETRDWLAAENVRVYKHVIKKDWLLQDGRGLYSYCEDASLTGFSEIHQGEIKNACTKASTVLFLQWASPFLVLTCNFVCAGFCMLFSHTLGKVSASQATLDDKAKELIIFMKRFLLVIILAISFMYVSTNISGAAVKLSSALLAMAAISSFVMLLWLLREVDSKLLGQLKETAPILKNVISILQSNWVKAIAVGGLNMFIPLLAVLDILRQKIRVCTGVYSDSRAKERFTPQGKNVADSLAIWNWTSILCNVCVLAEVFILLLIGMKGTYVFFSFLNYDVLEPLNLSIAALTALVFFIGLGMFLCPIVPGTAVYLFAGVVIGFASTRPGSVGLGLGLVYASVAGSLAKHMACTGQYLMGYVAGKSVRVQKFVGVDKVPIRAMESVLQKKGFDLFKVCILVAGPDFPVSMLCGILKLNIPQMLLGTCPVILVSIIPQTLVGILLTQGSGDGLLGMISFAATGAAAAVQAGATLVFSYGIMKAVEERGQDLAKPRPEHEAVEELTRQLQDYENALKKVSEWENLGRMPKAVLLGAVASFLVSGFVLMVDFMASASEKLVFLKFALNNRISSCPDDSAGGDCVDIGDLGGTSGKIASMVVMPTGPPVLLLAFAALVLHVSFGKWLSRQAKREVVVVQPTDHAGTDPA